MSQARSHLFAFTSALTAFCVGSCGDAESTGPTVDPSAIAFTVETDVDSASEVQLCKFVTMPTDRGDVLAVNQVDHAYTAGSHHFLVYRTSLDTMPDGGDTLVPCDETEWMSQVRGVAYAAQSPTGSLAMPAGVAQHFASGEVLLVQTHYLNPGSEALRATIDFTFHTVPVDEAPTEAGVLFFFNPIIHLPPYAEGRAELECPIADDVTLLFAASHMHKRGVSFEAHVDDAAAGSLYASEEWAEPLPREFVEGEGGAINAGSTIRFACDFKNDGADTVMVGPSAETDEMCMFIGLYYPKLDSDTELCNRGTATTQGTTSCMDTVSCAGACATDDTACRATCLSEVCPTAAMPLLRFLQCFGPACRDVCATEGSGSAGCTGCVTSSCLGEVSACQAATCLAP